MLNKPRLAGFEYAPMIEIPGEFRRYRHIGIEYRAITSEQRQHVRAEGTVILRHERSRTRERGARRDLGLRIASEELVELDEAVDEVEGDLRAEDRVFRPAHIRVGLEDRQARLLDAEPHRLADAQLIVTRFLRDGGNAAKTDIVNLVGSRADAKPWRSVGKRVRA